MKLYPIYVTGIKAYCSDVIVDPDSPGLFYFMSIAGYQTAVKGIIANVLEQCRVKIYIEEQVYDLFRLSYEYRVLTKKMPSGLVHTILYPKLAIPINYDKNQHTFFIFTEKHNDIYSLFLKHIDDRTDIPLHPSWARWLWNVFLKEEWITELCTIAGLYKGYSIWFSPEHLSDLISEAIRYKENEIITCMQFNGGDAYGKRNFA